MRSGLARLRVDELEPRDVPASIGLIPGGPPPLAVSGLTDGTVKLYPPLISTGQYNTSPTTLAPFPGFAGVVRTAFADVNGDAVQDLIAVTGPGTLIRFKVISGTDFATVLIQPTDPFVGSEFTGGGFVAGGDIDNDGRDDIAITPDQGGGPRVVVFSLLNNRPVLRASFFGISDDPEFRGGARVAVGDVNADGFDDVAVAAGPGGGPRIAVFTGRTLFTRFPPVKLVDDFFAYPTSVDIRDGVYIAAGDIDGDGFADLVFGSGIGGGPRVRVLSGRLMTAFSVSVAQTSPLEDFFYGDPTTRGGVRVAAKPTGLGTRDEVVVGSGAGLPSKVRVYSGFTAGGTAEPRPFQDIDPFGRTLADGVYVG